MIELDAATVETLILARDAGPVSAVVRVDGEDSPAGLETDKGLRLLEELGFLVTDPEASTSDETSQTNCYAITDAGVAAIG